MATTSAGGSLYVPWPWAVAVMAAIPSINVDMRMNRTPVDRDPPSGSLPQ